MLYLTRKVGDSVVINDNIEVTVVEVRGKTVKLGFTFPKMFRFCVVNFTIAFRKKTVLLRSAKILFAIWALSDLRESLTTMAIPKATNPRPSRQKIRQPLPITGPFAYGVRPRICRIKTD